MSLPVGWEPVPEKEVAGTVIEGVCRGCTLGRFAGPHAEPLQKASMGGEGEDFRRTRPGRTLEVETTRP